MGIEIAREMSTASDSGISHGWRRASWKSVLVSLSRAAKRLVSQRWAAPLWRSRGPDALPEYRFMRRSGTCEGVTPAPTWQRSNAGGAVIAQSTALASMDRPDPISRGPEVGRTTALVHDLNNLLGIVQVNLQLLDREIADADQRALIKDAHDATELSNELIRGLFAERSGQVTRPLRLDLNEELGAIGNLIRKRLGPGIQVEQDLAKDLGAIYADPTLLRNACLNLVANAGAAMTSGGRLVVVTSNVEIDASTASTHIDAKPGAYVKLSLRDTGAGIPPETLGRIFEPYFTTKTSGESLGLGLALVQEFCQRFEGFVRAESAVGKGTTVSIYLPRHDDRLAAG